MKTEVLSDIENKYVGKFVLYAGGSYECVGVVDLFGCIFLEIYDEPPSNHIDQIRLSSVQSIQL